MGVHATTEEKGGNKHVRMNEGDFSELPGSYEMSKEYNIQLRLET